MMLCGVLIVLCSLLLSTVSGEGVKERSDRVLLAPWVKFLWESYRNMLELLKNNNTIEKVYADVAKEGKGLTCSCMCQCVCVCVCVCQCVFVGGWMGVGGWVGVCVGECAGESVGGWVGVGVDLAEESYFSSNAAFKFCLTYERRTEFRKLCEIVSICHIHFLLFCVDSSSSSSSCLCS